VNNITRRACLALGASGLGVLALAWPAHAYTIFPPHSMVAGRSIADWTAAWWTWALQAPVSENPLNDTNGAFATRNNNGPVFFVAGTFGTSGPVTRSFDVPAGKPILFPLVNLFDTEPAEIDPPTATLEDRKTAAELVVAGWVNAVDPASLFASIDGSAVTNPAQYLELTGLFSMGPAQAGSLIASLGVPVGAELYPTKAAGYWLMIDGLAPGSHTLHFGGSSNAFTPKANCCTTSEISAFSTDVTDNIFIPEPASALLLVTGLLGLFALRLTPLARDRC
jgi:hypothetical protein